MRPPFCFPEPRNTRKSSFQFKFVNPFRHEPQTKKQVDPQLQNLSFVDATKKIVKDEGMGALLAGLGPTIWGYLLEGAMVSFLAMYIYI